jgi:hypothetical protein
VGNGFIAQVDPQAWSIVDGRLYLNFSKDVRTKWKKDIQGYIEKGDRNWPAVLKK